MDIFRSDVLAGKSILVTGGGSGLGLEISKALAAKGATVHICGRRANVLEAAAAEIAAGTVGKVHWHTCDIRDADQVDAMVEAMWKVGPVTSLVNNAAANFIAPTKGLSPRGFRAITSTVMDGSFHVTLALGKRWIDEGIKGAVVSNLVTWVWTGSAFVVPSAMAKTALHAMTMSLAVEWGPYGIRLNATAPGPFPTESAWEKLNPIPDAKSSATSAETVPLRRFGAMPELQNLITFLLSDGCDYLTGQTIAIDGGQHLAGPGTFADLTGMTDDQWQTAREAIEQSTQRDKANRAG
ncbi:MULTISPECIES: SDR family oxidoreductase [unclassified Sphingopyxis]|uniref:SDR family oxidoreductase n=1 Tax=unclassified Sphingopyxis TaxID=2614943 RepID=UPI0028588372|nr:MULTISPECIES: SDR family oxidoreductase [unclassified Sphingopyxis]MDR6834097.1 NAD(P)-dependent dehydrogenase (short-subunit alcohol dehydrogenase family) [Sphingopyxis sp. BE122]MDR7226365.1 NAD(P)-dependent dehydrogenase (short-subunit alcohol dehydrogenase family) [Sphingopyxis sp. BE259]